MTHANRTLLSRRGLLGAAVLGAAWPRRAAARPRPSSTRRLVLVQLSGGNDGLNTVVPYDQEVYRTSRPTLALDPSSVLPIAPGRALHPELVGLRRLFDDGRLAIVEGCGYRPPNRSHFQSLEIWHTADLRGRAAGDGWIARLAESAWPDARDPELVVHVGARVPWSLHSSSRPPAAFVAPSAYRWAGGPEEIRAYEAAGKRSSSDAGRLAELREILRDSQDSSRRIRAAAARYRPRAEYPTDAFGWSLRDIAALIDADLGTRVLSVELAGFDTHRDQLRRQADLLRRLDRGLTAFLSDLRGAAAEETLVLVFSEFGRRVAENGSQGTDHGTAGPVLLLGPVEGGLRGRAPSLTELDAGDLVPTTDFRCVYATAIDWLGGDVEAVLGGEYPRV